MKAGAHTFVFLDHANGASNLRNLLVLQGQKQLECDEMTLPQRLRDMAWTGGLFHVEDDTWRNICVDLKRSTFAIRCKNAVLPNSHKLTSGGGLAMNCIVPIQTLTKADIASLLTMLASDDERANLVAGVVPAGLRNLIPAGATSTIEAVKALVEVMLIRAQCDRAFCMKDRLAFLGTLGMEIDALRGELQKESSGLGYELPDNINNLVMSTPNGEAIGSRPQKTEVVVIYEAHQALVRLLEG